MKLVTIILKSARFSLAASYGFFVSVPGDFVLEKSQLYVDMTSGEVKACVLRQNGADGDAEVNYATMLV